MNAERKLALELNKREYARQTHDSVVDGSPHLKHPSVKTLYAQLAERALGLVRTNEPTTVLELGAGDGLASEPWFRSDIRLTSVDGSAAMLDRLASRAATRGVAVTTVVSDAFEHARDSDERYAIVTCVSMLHHVPDYLELLRVAVLRVKQGGCLLTFQDPLRYDRMPRRHRLLQQASYYAWRITRGGYGRGIKTRLRRIRGVYSASEEADYGEYHVVRNGVDSEAIVQLLKPFFGTVERHTYWSTQAAIWQTLGEWLNYKSNFGTLAVGRR